MRKLKPLTDADIDKFIADLDPELDAQEQRAQAVARIMAEPVPQFHLLKAIIGGVLFSGSILFLIYWMYPIYSKLLGGNQ